MRSRVLRYCMYANIMPSAKRQCYQLLLYVNPEKLRVNYIRALVLHRI